MTPKESYVTDYPQAIDYVEKQLSVMWFENEVRADKDVHDILVNMTEAERHGVITVLRLFTKYELIIGTEYWGDVVAKMFPRPDIIRMCNCFAFFELNVHGPFYSKLNKALFLDTDKFYTEYQDDPELVDRIDFMQSNVGHDPYTTLMTLALLEGAVLYSSFAFLKHFQSRGKNKLLNIVRGINFSAVDENIHSEASAWLFRTLCEESKLDKEALANLQTIAHDMAHVTYEHERNIIRKIFEKGDIEGITATQLELFVQSRINLVLRNLGFTELFKVTYNPIGEWFYAAMTGYTSTDFFSGVGREYSRSWSEDDFTWG